MDGRPTSVEPAPAGTVNLIAVVAADANGRVARDAKVHVRYLRPAEDHGREVDALIVPWRAQDAAVADVLRRNGWLAITWDLVVTDGYERHITLELAEQAPPALCEHCGERDRYVRGVCVENRVPEEGVFAGKRVRVYACPDAQCRHCWTRLADGTELP